MCSWKMIWTTLHPPCPPTTSTVQPTCAQHPTSYRHGSIRAESAFEKNQKDRSTTLPKGLSLSLFLYVTLFLSFSLSLSLLSSLLSTHRYEFNQSNDSTNEERSCTTTIHYAHQFLVDMVCGPDHDGTWSSSVSDVLDERKCPLASAFAVVGL